MKCWVVESKRSFYLLINYRNLIRDRESRFSIEKRIAGSEICITRYSQGDYSFLFNSFRVSPSRGILLAWNIAFRASNEISHDAASFTGRDILFIIRTWRISRFEEEGKLSTRGIWQEVIDAKHTLAKLFSHLSFP